MLASTSDDWRRLSVSVDLCTDTGRRKAAFDPVARTFMVLGMQGVGQLAQSQMYGRWAPN